MTQNNHKQKKKNNNPNQPNPPKNVEQAKKHSTHSPQQNILIILREEKDGREKGKPRLKMENGRKNEYVNSNY